MTKRLKTNSKKRIDEERNTHYKNNRAHARYAGQWWITENKRTNKYNRAFADSNAISRVERIFAALMGHQPVQTGRPAA